MEFLKDIIEQCKNKTWWFGIITTLSIFLVIFTGFNFINISPIEISTYNNKYTEKLNETLEFPNVDDLFSKNKKYILNFNNYNDSICVYDLNIRFNNGEYAGQKILRTWCIGDDSLNKVELEEYNLLLERISVPENEITFVVENRNTYSWNYLVWTNLGIIALISFIMFLIDIFYIKKKDKKSQNK